MMIEHSINSILIVLRCQQLVHISIFGYALGKDSLVQFAPLFTVT
jgi:hypothetical protein